MWHKPRPVVERLIKGGPNREVRRLRESQGLTVSCLSRVRYGPVIPERGLRPGKSRPLSDTQLQELYSAAGLKLPAGGKQ